MRRQVREADPIDECQCVQELIRGRVAVGHQRMQARTEGLLQLRCERVDRGPLTALIVGAIGSVHPFIMRDIRGLRQRDGRRVQPSH